MAHHSSHPLTTRPNTSLALLVTTLLPDLQPWETPAAVYMPPAVDSCYPKLRYRTDGFISISLLQILIRTENSLADSPLFTGKLVFPGGLNAFFLLLEPSHFCPSPGGRLYLLLYQEIEAIGQSSLTLSPPVYWPPKISAPGLCLFSSSRRELCIFIKATFPTYASDPTSLLKNSYTCLTALLHSPFHSTVFSFSNESGP